VSLEKFLSSVLFYAEKGEPLPIAFEKTKKIHKLKMNYDKVYEISRLLILSYFSLKSKNRSQKIREFLEKGPSPTLPEWIKNELSPYINLEELEKSLVNKTVWFRPNSLKRDPDKILKSLEIHGIRFEQDKDFPFVYRLLEGDLRKTNEFKNFDVIIQDKASVAVVMSLNPEKKEKILDLSSAPGLKAQLIQELTENSAKLFLADLDIKRLSKEKFLLRKYGVNLDNTEFILQDSSYNSILRSDKILLDAPCSSSGMISNEPVILLTLKNSEKVMKYNKIQDKILRNSENINAEELVYSVCSIFPEEGEDHFNQLYEIAERPLNIGCNGYSSKISERSIRFLPNIHSTEGFFITKLNLNKLR
jgi:16S rRNA (cytosine967-C5)-methyltransferase